MAPNITGQTLLLGTTTIHQKHTVSAPTSPNLDPKEKTYEWEISWRNVIAFIYLHGAALYGIYNLFTLRVMLLTIIWYGFIVVGTAFGITAGAHRLWAHKAYKATWQLRLILAFFQTMAFQNHIYEWVRDHRVHHKFMDTDADPHNVNRGFFFSHMGWLMVRKHPDVKKKGATVDMTDLESDPVVVWQKRTYLFIMPLLCFALPTWVPIYFWGEDPWISWYGCIARYVLTLNGTWLVNSAAHIWGNKPYDAKISPSENAFVGVLAVGEGWHNYHHVFPWDYKAAELGSYQMNWTTGLIDMFAKIGWAYNLRTVSPDIVKRRAKRTGDGTLFQNHGHHSPDHHDDNNVWGWDDPDLPNTDREQSRQLHCRES